VERGLYHKGVAADDELCNLAPSKKEATRENPLSMATTAPTERAIPPFDVSDETLNVEGNLRESFAKLSADIPVKIAQRS
jgi:hypothetical protein